MRTRHFYNLVLFIVFGSSLAKNTYKEEKRDETKGFSLKEISIDLSRDIEVITRDELGIKFIKVCTVFFPVSIIIQMLANEFL